MKPHVQLGESSRPHLLSSVETPLVGLVGWSRDQDYIEAVLPAYIEHPRGLTKICLPSLLQLRTMDSLSSPTASTRSAQTGSIGRSSTVDNPFDSRVKIAVQSPRRFQPAPRQWKSTPKIKTSPQHARKSPQPALTSTPQIKNSVMYGPFPLFQRCMPNSTLTRSQILQTCSASLFNSRRYMPAQPKLNRSRSLQELPLKL